MNLSQLPRNQGLISVFAAALFLPMSLSFGLGQLKNASDIAALDILGEGCVALLSATWIIAILTSRPPGRVTTGLAIGLSCFMFSALLDLFDEFVIYQNTAIGLSLMESIPAALGMLIMSYALWLWHHEQLVLNKQLQRREWGIREHQQIDFITQLYSAEYMRGQLDIQLRENSGKPFAVAMLDIDHFDAFNREYGRLEGDRLLREISELILMNLRNTDLACRYASDRFIILLPNTDIRSANELAEQVRSAIQHLAFKTEERGITVYNTLSFATEVARPNDGVEALIQRVNEGINLTKRYA